MPMHPALPHRSLLQAGAPARPGRAAAKPSGLTVRPLTASRWGDFERLFGPNGACAGCWCLWCRLPKREYERVKGPKAKRAMKGRARRGPAPGLLAYEGGVAVGWCAVGPREEFRRLEASRILKPIDGRAAWAAPCLFVARSHRGRGVTVALLDAAARHARRRGAGVIEGYPVRAKKGVRQADAFLWWGVDGAFKKAGFFEAARPSASRSIMRRELGKPR